MEAAILSYLRYDPCRIDEKNLCLTLPSVIPRKCRTEYDANLLGNTSYNSTYRMRLDFESIPLIISIEAMSI